LKNGLAYYNAGVVAVNLKIAGLAPGLQNQQEKKNFKKEKRKLCRQRKRTSTTEVRSKNVFHCERSVAG
jgi:hypothetical protein